MGVAAWAPLVTIVKLISFCYLKKSCFMKVSKTFLHSMHSVTKSKKMRPYSDVTAEGIGWGSCLGAPNENWES